MFGGIDVDTKDIFGGCKEEKRRDSYFQCFRNMYCQGQMLSDLWRVYLTVKNIGYNHVTVNFVDPQTGATTNPLLATQSGPDKLPRRLQQCLAK